MIGFNLQKTYSTFPQIIKQESHPLSCRVCIVRALVHLSVYGHACVTDSIIMLSFGRQHHRRMPCLRNITCCTSTHLYGTQNIKTYYLFITVSCSAEGASKNMRTTVLCVYCVTRLISSVIGLLYVQNVNMVLRTFNKK